MSKILQLETATQTCSVALSVNGETVVLKEESASNIHAGSLTLFVDTVMKQYGISYTELDAVAVSKGPGSYTGLRIGVSTAKGLCFALDKPLIAVDTLQMMANGYLSAHPAMQGFICPMIDARRMEVYTALYDSDLQNVSAVEAKIIDESSFLSELQHHQITFIGDGAAKCQDKIQHENATFVNGNFNSAQHMSKLAAQLFEQRAFEDVAYFEPYYLKDFVVTSPKKKV